MNSKPRRDADTLDNQADEHPGSDLDAVSEAPTVQEGTLQEEYKRRPNGHDVRSETLW